MVLLKKKKREKMITYDVYLLHPFTMMISGPTGCGKTVWIRNLVNSINQVSKPIPTEIFYFYGEYQTIFETFKNTNFIKGLSETMMEKFDGSKPTLIIIDDLMIESASSKLISEIYTKGSHHRNLSIILLVQNLFIRGTESRNISLNSQYFVLFKNPRDQSIATNIARQMFPSKIKKFQAIYEEATKNPFSYLFIDLKPNTPNEIRLLTNVLGEGLMQAYTM